MFLVQWYRQFRHILLSGSNQCCGKLGANLTNLLFVVVDEGTKNSLYLRPQLLINGLNIFNTDNV